VASKAPPVNGPAKHSGSGVTKMGYLFCCNGVLMDCGW
jgi:hypothetical protein